MPRMGRKEAAVNRFKWAVVIVAAFALAALIYAAGKATAQAPAAAVIRAQKFELVDSQGKVRAGLGLLSNGSPSLALLDSGGKVRTGLGLRADGSSWLTLADSRGKPRAILDVQPDGSPTLWLFDSGGKGGVDLAVQPDGSPMLELTDRAGKVIWRTP